MEPTMRTINESEQKEKIKDFAITRKGPWKAPVILEECNL